MSCNHHTIKIILHLFQLRNKITRLLDYDTTVLRLPYFNFSASTHTTTVSTHSTTCVWRNLWRLELFVHDVLSVNLWQNVINCIV